MPLIACPECTKSISDAAAACIHCGHPIGALALAGAGAGAAASSVNVRIAPTDPTALACPRCSSEDTRKLSMIWREGTSDINTHTSGIGINGGLGVGTAKTKGTAQTLASQGAAPPQRQGILKPAIVAFFAFYGTTGGLSNPETLGVGMAAALVLVPCAWIIWSRFKFNRETYPVLMRRWEHSFRCQRCENVFEVT